MFRGKTMLLTHRVGTNFAVMIPSSLRVNSTDRHDHESILHA